jgi:Ca2+-transporting ATPase
MERKPRPLRQPVLSRAQWLRITFFGVLIAIATLVLEMLYMPDGDALMYTMGFAVFSLLNVAMGLSSRSETDTVFTRDFIADRRQLLLYGLALFLTFLPTELGFIQTRFGLTSLTLEQWLIGAALAFALILVYEVVKFFMRRSRRATAASTPAEVAAAQA